MNVIMGIVFGIVGLALLAVSAIQPKRSGHSGFELERRIKKGDEQATIDERRERLHADVFSVLKVVQLVLLVLFVSLSIGIWGPMYGVLASVGIALFAGSLARLPVVRNLSQKQYDLHETKLLEFVNGHPKLLSLVRSVTPLGGANGGGVESRDELEYIVRHSGGIIDDHEKKLILSSLEFKNRLVSDIMTPKSMIEGIAKNEVLGPLVLDDLHKTGHTRFPVIDEDVDHVVGVLHIQQLLMLKDKDTTTAEQAMEKAVYYIRDDHTLDHALTAFIKSKHHLFIVVNDYRETVGLLTLEDCMEALLGRPIVDEFDRHDDLRAVASRNVGRNNLPVHRHDV